MSAAGEFRLNRISHRASLNIVIPCHNEEGNLRPLAEAIARDALVNAPRLLADFGFLSCFEPPVFARRSVFSAEHAG